MVVGGDGRLVAEFGVGSALLGFSGLNGIFFHFSVERDREKKETEKYKGSGKIARGSDAKFDIGCSKSNSYKGRTIDEGRSTSNSYGNIHTRTFKYSILQFNSSLISLIPVSYTHLTLPTKRIV